MLTFGRLQSLISALALTAAMASAQSGPVMRLGENSPLTPPFCETFDNFRSGMEHDDFPRYFQTIDSNGDDRSWGLYNYKAEPYGRCAYMLYPLEPAKADDWLITRAVKLEKGKYYCISMDAALYTDDSGKTPQVFEVKVGTYNDADGLKTTVIPSTSVSSRTFTHVHGWFRPDYTAKYYVGVHGISPRYSDYYNYLFIDNIAVEAPKEGGEPAGVTAVAMTNDPRGTNAVEITFTAPEKAIDGSALESLTAITVSRDGAVVATVNAPAPGQVCKVTDTPAEEGSHNYTFTPSNSVGEGETLQVAHTCGISAPVAPVISSFKEGENGELILTWEAPTVDVSGNAIDPEMLTYTVTDYSDGLANQVANDISETEFTYEIDLAEGAQKMALCTVSAEINGKMSEEAATDVLAVGTPYALPYHNSFTLDDYYDYVMSIEVVDNVSWRMLDDYSDPDAQDGDNGYVCMVGDRPDQQCTLWSGKIDLGAAKRPELTFWTYAYSDDENLINVKVFNPATGVTSTAATIELSQFTSVGWQRVSCPLEAYAGQTVCIGLQGVIVTHGYLPVDNFLIEDMPAVDLEISLLNYPRQARVNEPFTVSALIGNRGWESASDYTVSLMAGDREVCTVEGLPVKSSDSEWVELTDCFNAISEPSTTYTVRINAKADARPENNVSEPFTVVFAVPNLPAVTDLQGTEQGQTVSLTWSAPDLSSAAPEEKTEDFESYEAFATELADGWTMQTLDDGLVAGFQDLTMPVQGTQQAFWVMEATGSFSFIPTHSGTKSLIAMYALSEKNTAVASNDWLISPELFGGQQSINFWACSLTDDYGLEQFEVWYSTTGNSTTDFKLLAPVAEAPEDWTNYFVSLPEGTRYFAIRYRSEDRYMFIVDDITFIPAGAPRSLELAGYNVYCGSTKLNDALLTSTSFTAPRTPEGGRFYVTAVYDKGESAGSNVIDIANVGIDAVGADPTAPAEYFDLRGIRIDPATAAPGIYLRRSGSSTSKVTIRR